jgi:hypothetical protein
MRRRDFIKANRVRGSRVVFVRLRCGRETHGGCWTPKYEISLYSSGLHASV